MESYMEEKVKSFYEFDSLVKQFKTIGPEYWNCKSAKEYKSPSCQMFLLSFIIPSIWIRPVQPYAIFCPGQID